MVKQFLITRPNYDRETSYIHSFSKGIVAYAKEERSIHMTELEGAEATKERFEKEIKRTSPKLIFLNGHGDEKVVKGHKDKTILDKDNVKLLSKKIVYALACESLAKIGKEAVKKGAKAYLGYEKEFRWVVDLTRTSSPDKDKNAAPFRRVCHLMGKNLLSGVPAGETIKKTEEEYRRLIRSYGTSEDNYGDAPLIGLMLTWDMMFLGMAGDSEAVF